MRLGFGGSGVFSGIVASAVVASSNPWCCRTIMCVYMRVIVWATVLQHHHVCTFANVCDCLYSSVQIQCRLFFVFGGSGVSSGSCASGSCVKEFFMSEWSDRGATAPSCVCTCVPSFGPRCCSTIMCVHVRKYVVVSIHQSG